MDDNVRAGIEDIKRVVAFWDQDQPGWRSRVDLTQFNLGSPWCCILSYVYGSYTAGEQEVWKALGPMSVGIFASRVFEGTWRRHVLDRGEVE
jgi:hypothetical protein